MFDSLIDSLRRLIMSCSQDDMSDSERVKKAWITRKQHMNNGFVHYSSEANPDFAENYYTLTPGGSADGMYQPAQESDFLPNGGWNIGPDGRIQPEKWRPGMGPRCPQPPPPGADWKWEWDGLIGGPGHFIKVPKQKKFDPKDFNKIDLMSPKERDEHERNKRNAQKEVERCNARQKHLDSLKPGMRIKTRHGIATKLENGNWRYHSSLHKDSRGDRGFVAKEISSEELARHNGMIHITPGGSIFDTSGVSVDAVSGAINIKNEISPEERRKTLLNGHEVDWDKVFLDHRNRQSNGWVIL